MSEFNLDIGSLFNSTSNSITNFLPSEWFQMFIPIVISTFVASFLHKMLDISYIKCFTFLLLAQYIFLYLGSYSLNPFY